MKQLLITIAALVVVGCGESQQSATAPEVKPIERVEGAKAPDISIYDAAFDGDIEAIKQHLAAGTDLNAKNEIGSTPLHYAVRGVDKEVAELLIACGADVNAREMNRTTPLDWAILENQSKLAELLRKHGGKTEDELKAAGN